MKPDQFARLLAFLNRLRSARIAYALRQSRDDALMVQINVPGERWEVEFLEDGDVEVECFRGMGEILDANALDDLFAQHSSAKELEEVASEHDKSARD